MKKNIVVTGGAGFVGSSLISYFWGKYIYQSDAILNSYGRDNETLLDKIFQEGD